MVISSKFRRRGQLGFTLIELMIVISIILILLAIAIPNYRNSVRKANESVLRDDLFTLRDLIEKYTLDKGKPPQSLDDLVQAGYIRAIPKDPITGKNDTWQTSTDDAYASVDQYESGISDVHSGAQGSGLDGTAYAQW